MPNWSSIQHPALRSKLKRCYYVSLFTLILNAAVTLPVVILCHRVGDDDDKNLHIYRILALVSCGFAITVIFTKTAKMIVSSVMAITMPLFIAAINLILCIMFSEYGFFGDSKSEKESRFNLFNLVIPGVVIIHNVTFLAVAMRIVRICTAVSIVSQQLEVLNAAGMNDIAESILRRTQAGQNMEEVNERQLEEVETLPKYTPMEEPTPSYDIAVNNDEEHRQDTHGGPSSSLQDYPQINSSNQDRQPHFDPNLNTPTENFDLHDHQNQENIQPSVNNETQIEILNTPQEEIPPPPAYDD